MRELDVTFKQALNDAIRQSARGGMPRFDTHTASLGQSKINLDRALQVVADLEDDELIRRMRAGS